MNKAFVVAKWEFIATVTRVPYIVAVVGLPLLYGGLFTIAGLSSRNAAVSSSRIPAAVVDQAHVVDLRFAAERSAERDAPVPMAGQEVMTMAARRFAGRRRGHQRIDGDAAAARPVPRRRRRARRLRARTVSSVFVVGTDYMTTGQITSYARPGNMLGQQADRQRQTQLADAIRAGILKTAVADHPQIVSRAFGPTAHMTRMRLRERRPVRPRPTTRAAFGAARRKLWCVHALDHVDLHVGGLPASRPPLPTWLESDARDPLLLDRSRRVSSSGNCSASAVPG